MNILKKIKEYAAESGLKAVSGPDGELTYEQLDRYSDYLASYIEQNSQDCQRPVVVYGHKSVYMLVSFLAAVKSGRAYCPIDHFLPPARVQKIVDCVEPSLILDVEENSGFTAEGQNILRRKEICEIARRGTGPIDPEYAVRDEDIFYIIFTSGSSGTPKGVKITANCLNHYLEWSVELGGSAAEKKEKVFLNQAPFSFDLSVMDMYTCLATGGTLYLMPREIAADYGKLMTFLTQSDVSVWVSTPSFADLCLADKNFNEMQLPKLQLLLFCGETLGVSTAARLQERFPTATIINTYGPTESTVAVTGTVITREMLQKGELLPVGVAKPGTQIEIWKSDQSLAAEGEEGEIIIIGDTVSPGYYRLASQNEKVFFVVARNGQIYRGYRTGDLGYLRGRQLYCTGRMNRQIKLHGYRIELQDIEQNLQQLPQIENAAVVPSRKDGKIISLTAFVTGEKCEEKAFLYAKRTKEQLKEYLPDYMIPKKIIQVEMLPMNQNGKVDYRYLEEIV